MTVGIDDGKFQLVDNFPGIPDNGPNPDDWTAFDSEAKFAVGTKRQVYDDANNGLATLTYLQFIKGAAAVAAVKSPCGLHTASVLAAGSAYKVSNDFSEIEGQGPIAVALGTAIDEYFGWFWTGGVCPVSLVPGLDGIFPSDGSITAGFNGLLLVDNSGVCQFSIGVATSVSNLTAGMSHAVDTVS